MSSEGGLEDLSLMDLFRSEVEMHSEALSAAQREGWRTGRATASASAALAPLGALAHLLPGEVVDARADPVSLYTTVSKALAGTEITLKAKLA